MRVKNKKIYYLKKKTIIEDNEGGKYSGYSEPIEIKANISPASGKLQAEIYGERLNYILNMLYDGPYKVIVKDNITLYVVNDIELCEGYGICVYVSKESEPDYKIISIKRYSHLVIELEKIL